MRSNAKGFEVLCSEIEECTKLLSQEQRIKERKLADKTPTMDLINSISVLVL